MNINQTLVNSLRGLLIC